VSGSPPPLRGLHHVTAIARDLERTTAFYRDVLGLELVEAGVNDDDPGTRHFWFGAAGGPPGTLVSFLEYPEMAEGRAGAGATHHFALEVGSPEDLVAWLEHLRDRGIPCTEVFQRGAFSSVYLRDPDGHIIELATRGPGFGGEAGPGRLWSDPA
jgi:catechol 2,3-dioxygenase-like lactoylglutathione lyase family enzyme